MNWKRGGAERGSDCDGDENDGFLILSGAAVPTRERSSCLGSESDRTLYLLDVLIRGALGAGLWDCPTRDSWGGFCPIVS